MKCLGCGAPGYQTADPVTLILLRETYRRWLAAGGAPLGAVAAHLLAYPHQHTRVA